MMETNSTLLILLTQVGKQNPSIVVSKIWKVDLLIPIWIIPAAPVSS